MLLRVICWCVFWCGVTQNALGDNSTSVETDFSTTELVTEVFTTENIETSYDVDKGNETVFPNIDSTIILPNEDQSNGTKVTDVDFSISGIVDSKNTSAQGELQGINNPGLRHMSGPELIEAVLEVLTEDDDSLSVPSDLPQSNASSTQAPHGHMPTLLDLLSHLSNSSTTIPNNHTFEPVTQPPSNFQKNSNQLVNITSSVTEFFENTTADAESVLATSSSEEGSDTGVYIGPDPDHSLNSNTNNTVVEVGVLNGHIGDEASQVTYFLNDNKTWYLDLNPETVNTDHITATDKEIPTTTSDEVSPTTVIINILSKDNTSSSNSSLVDTIAPTPISPPIPQTTSFGNTVAGAGSFNDYAESDMNTGDIEGDIMATGDSQETSTLREVSSISLPTGKGVGTIEPVYLWAKATTRDSRSYKSTSPSTLPDKMFCYVMLTCMFMII